MDYWKRGNHEARPKCRANDLVSLSDREEESPRAGSYGGRKLFVAGSPAAVVSQWKVDSARNRVDD